MNQLIKQITGQVLDELVPETWTSLGYDKIKEIQYRTAELIVVECVKVMVKNDYHGEWLGEKVKEHFGVAL
jgi:hypothetical protein